jgi:hypothetical protein
MTESVASILERDSKITIQDWLHLAEKHAELAKLASVLSTKS